jgi:hypothetical protein
MDLGKLLVAHSKTMEIMQLSMSRFDYPSIFSKATAMLSAALRENGFALHVACFVLSVRYDSAGWIDASNSGVEATVRCLPTSRRQRLWRSPPPW